MSTLFSGHYLRNRSTLDIGVLGYISIVQHKEHSPGVLSIPPGTPCIFMVSEGEVSWDLMLWHWVGSKDFNAIKFMVMQFKKNRYSVIF